MPRLPSFAFGGRLVKVLLFCLPLVGCGTNGETYTGGDPYAALFSSFQIALKDTVESTLDRHDAKEICFPQTIGHPAASWLRSQSAATRDVCEKLVTDYAHKFLALLTGPNVPKVMVTTSPLTVVDETGAVVSRGAKTQPAPGAVISFYVGAGSIQTPFDRFILWSHEIAHQAAATSDETNAELLAVAFAFAAHRKGILQKYFEVPDFTTDVATVTDPTQPGPARNPLAVFIFHDLMAVTPTDQEVTDATAALRGGQGRVGLVTHMLRTDRYVERAVRMAIQETLGRPAQQAEIDHFLQNVPRDEISIEGLRYAYASSSEFQSATSNVLDDVRRLYGLFLGRPASDYEANFHSGGTRQMRIDHIALSVEARQYYFRRFMREHVRRDPYGSESAGVENRRLAGPSSNEAFVLQMSDYALQAYSP